MTEIKPVREAEISERIKAERLKRKMTLQELADASGSSKSYIWEIENNNMRRPSFAKTRKIAAALGITMDDLAEGKSNTETQADNAFVRLYLHQPPAAREKMRRIAGIIFVGGN